MSAHITGKLITVGNYTEEEQIDLDNPLARAVVVMPREALKAVCSLPMYEDVLIVKAEEWDRLQRENARLQMELDASCNAEELRQVRAKNAALREALDGLSYLAHDRTQTRVTLREAIDAARKEAHP